MNWYRSAGCSHELVQGYRMQLWIGARRVIHWYRCAPCAGGGFASLRLRVIASNEMSAKRLGKLIFAENRISLPDFLPEAGKNTHREAQAFRRVFFIFSLVLQSKLVLSFPCNQNLPFGSFCKPEPADFSGHKKTELSKSGFTQSGGAYGARTRDLLTASQTRSQLR